MKSLIVAAVAIHALAVGAGDAAPIVKVGLYKNGLAVVTRKVTPDSTGTAVVDGSARPAYGTFWLSGRKADLRGIGSVLAYSLLLIAVEYGCFSLIMEVQTPTGLLF